MNYRLAKSIVVSAQHLSNRGFNYNQEKWLYPRDKKE
jgi:hypothetical protein